MPTTALDTTLLATRVQFGSRFASLPSELQESIIAHAAKTTETIQLSNLDAKLDTLSAPWQTVEALRLEAGTQAFRVNSFELNADQVVTFQHEGQPPVIVFLASLQTLTSAQCKDIRCLPLTFSIMGQGCDWDDAPPVKLHAKYAELLQVVPNIFPMLELLTIFVPNTGTIADEKVAYTRNGRSVISSQTAICVDWERRLRMAHFIRAFVDLELPRWRTFFKPPNRMLVFQQDARLQAGCRGYELRRVQAGRP